MSVAKPWFQCVYYGIALIKSNDFYVFGSGANKGNLVIQPLLMQVFQGRSILIFERYCGMRNNILIKDEAMNSRSLGITYAGAFLLISFFGGFFF